MNKSTGKVEYRMTWPEVEIKPKLDSCVECAPAAEPLKKLDFGM